MPAFSPVLGKEVNVVFTGTYENKMDSKGRTFLPAKLRRDCGDCFVLTRWLDNCVAVYTTEAWNALADRLRALPSAQARDTQRFFFSAAEKVELDKQGRVLIPPVLRQFADLQTDVVVIGAGERIEIWSKERWDAYNSTDSMQENIINAMIELGI